MRRGATQLPVVAAEVGRVFVAHAKPRRSAASKSSPSITRRASWGRICFWKFKGLIAVTDLIGRIAERQQATPAQVALAWLLAQKPWIVPVPGTTKLHRLEENVGAAEVELTPDDLREFEGAASKITLQGGP